MRSLRFKILLGLLMLLLGFMIMAIYTGGTASLFSQAVSYVTVPLQRLSTGISNNVTEFFDQFINIKSISAENELLRRENTELRQRLVDYEKAKHENEQYREIVGVMEERQDLSVTPASVIARDSMSQFYSFTIDKGSLEGVKPHDPVMTAEGLVGYVSEVGTHYSKVVTILDVTVKVGAYDSATRDIGIVTGTIDHAAQGLCILEYLPRESEIAPGNIVLTSGGSLFPKDLIVGTVTEVDPNSQGTSPAASIRTAADIPNLKHVFVITEFEGQGEEE